MNIYEVLFEHIDTFFPVYKTFRFGSSFTFGCPVVQLSAFLIQAYGMYAMLVFVCLEYFLGIIVDKKNKIMNQKKLRWK